MRPSSFSPVFRGLAVLLAAFVVNLGLYLLVPYIQVLVQRAAMAKKRPQQVVTAVLTAPPPRTERAARKEIKEIKTASFRPPSLTTARPTTPGGGLKLDLSVAGGEGMALVSGGDRTGLIGSGSGNGKGEGLAAMTYEQGQTDTDAKIIGPDPNPAMPARAEREGVSGYATVTFVVNEFGQAEQIQIMKEDPTGYGFAPTAIEAIKKLRFKPAVFEKMAVRQRLKRTFTYEIQ